MNTVSGHSTNTLRRVGALNKKLMAVFLAVLLTVMCIPILPGNVEEAQAETLPPTTETYYVVSNEEPAYRMKHILMGTATPTNYDAFTSGGLFVHNTTPANITAWYDSSGNPTTAPNTSGASVSTTQVGTWTDTSSYMFNPIVGYNPPPGEGLLWYPGGPSRYAGSPGNITFSWPGHQTSGSFNYSFSLGSININDNGVVWDSAQNQTCWFGLTANANVALNGDYTPTDVVYRYVVTRSGSQVPPTISVQDYDGVLGGAVPSYGFTQGVTGTYGITTTKKFGDTYGTSNGTITWSTGFSALTSDNLTFDKIGVESHSYLATDTSDNSTATGSRLVISKLGYGLDIEGEYASGASTGSAYDATDPSLEDGWTKEDVKVTTSIPYFNGLPVQGNYALNLQTGSLSDMSVTDTCNHTVTSNYNGVSTATLMGVGPYNTVALASPESMTVKIDKTAPVPDATLSVTGNVVTATDTSTDADSGMSARSANATKYAVVPTGNSPIASDFSTNSTITVSSGVGSYELWVWATDKAGNEAFGPSTAGSFIIVSADAPDIAGKLASGPDAGNALASNTWTNQDVEVTVTPPSSITTAYSALYNGLTQESKSGAINTTTSKTYSAETPAAGTPLFGVMVDALNTELSNHSSNYVVKIDKTAPVADATASVSVNVVTATDTSSDALSGLSTTKPTKFAVVPKLTTPADSDYSTSSTITVSGVGTYSLWVWATDEAGNETKALSTNADLIITSNAAPTIAGKLTTGPDAGNAIATGTWTNQSVEVTVTPPPTITTAYSALYNGLTLESKSPGINMTTSKTYSADTAGTTLFGVMVDSANTELSNHSGNYVVMIDTTPPTGDLTFNNGVGTPAWGFTDASYDNGGIQSGIDTSKTIAGIVPHGDPQPAKSSYESIATAELPATGYYDVWVIATDNAGNESTPVMAYEHISRSGKDEITAKDFSYDIAAGQASFTDAMAKMLSRVEGKPWGGGTPFNVTTQISVDPVELAAIQTAIGNGEKGTTHPLTFYTPAGLTQAQTTINVTIYDAGSPPDIPPGPQSYELIYANDFTWGISTGAISDNAARVASQVVGYDAIGDAIATGSLSVDSAELAAINGAIASGQKDTTWPLTFYTPVDNTSVTINVTLFDRGPVIPPQAGQEMIVGNDFSWGISTGSLGVAEALFLSNAQATSATGAPMASSTIQTVTADFTDINAAIAAGQKGTTWPITLTTDGSSGTAATTTVYVTLYDAGPPIIQAGDEMVVGNNFNWGISTGTLSQADSFALSNAKAYDANGTEMAMSNVDADPTELAAINTAIGLGQKGTTWPLTLTTKGLTGTAASAVIYVSLYDNGPIGPFNPGNEHIVGNNFNWGISTGDLNKSDAAALALIKATAGTGADLSLANVSISSAELDAINAAIAAGSKDTTWPLTFTTDGSTGTPASVTVQVSLFDNGPIGPFAPGNEHIVGNNFKWGIDTGSMTDAQANHLGRINATSGLGLPMTLAAGQVSCDATELAAINAAIAAGQTGVVLPLTFTTDGSSGPAASVTIYVTLFDAGHPNPVPGDPYIVSNNFSRAVDEGALSDDDARTLSAVEALCADGTCGQVTDITPDATQLATINTAIAAGDTSNILPLAFSYTCPQSGLTVASTSMVNLLGTSDLEVTKSVDNENPLPGDIITYTITAKNNGNATLQGIWIKDYVPEGTTYVSCDASGTYGANAQGKDYVNWYIATLSTGQEVVMTMKVKVNECSPGTVIENVALYQGNYPGFPANPDDDPQGGQTNPVSSTVGDPSQAAAQAFAAKSGKGAPKTGDNIMPVVIVGAVGILALLIVFFARRRARKDQS